MAWNQYSHNHNVSKCANAEIFVHQLTSLAALISNQSKGNAQQARLIYRGISDASHRMVPSALRTEEEQKPVYDMLWGISESRGNPVNVENRFKEVNQRRAELRVAQYFYQYSERAGLPLPPIPNPNVREELLTGHDGALAMAATGISMTPRGMQDSQWPPKEILPLLGLAQQYGLPTRLLDWSWSPLVSAYFAASGALKRLEGGADKKISFCGLGNNRKLVRVIWSARNNGTA